MMIKTISFLSKFSKAYLLIGFIFFAQIGFTQNQNKADSLIQLLDSSKEIADTAKLKILRGIYKNHTNPNLKLTYAQESLEIAIRLNNPLWMYRSTLHIGHAYKKKGNLQDALNAYFQSLKYSKTMGDNRREAISYSAIGGVYKTEGNQQTSLEYFNLGISKFREINDSTNLARSLMNTGELYRTNQILDTALLYFEESGEIFKIKNYEIGKAYNLGNIGLVYAARGEHQKAEKNLVEATEILQKLGDNYPIAVFNTYMADIYLVRGDMPRALGYAHNSYNLAVNDGLKEQIRDASHKLSVLYELNKDYEKAFLFQEEYLAYRDSINNEETVRQMADLRTEYEVSKKQTEVDLLNQEQKTSKVIRAGLLSLLLAIGALAFIYIKRNKEKRLSNILLTEQKHQLKVQHDELEVLNSTKDRFFSIISHDLRGPVSSFRGLTTIMKMSLEDKKYEELPSLTEMLDKSSIQLSSLLDNLLAWAVNQQGQFPYHPNSLQLKNLVNEVVGLIRGSSDAKQITIENQISEEIIAWIDYDSVKTIIRNLVNNALKFTPKGGLINLLAIEKANYVELKIIDNGVGMSAEKVENLFSMKGLNSAIGTEGEKGLGIGLRLAYDFAKMNKGTIKVESEEGKGATFTIILPVFLDTPKG